MLARRALLPLLKQTTTYGSVLLIGLCDLWSQEWLEWEAKTVQLELRDDFGIDVEPELFDRLMAARQVLTTDQAFTELPAFITLCHALLGDGVDTPVSEPMDPADLCWAVLEMCLIYPPSLNETFNDEIIGFMEETLRWQGVRGVPNALVSFLPEPTYDDAVASDPDITQLLFERLSDINSEVLAHLRAWKWQISQLKLVNGNTERLLEMFKGLEDSDKTQAEQSVDAA